jgi:CubicO group peptidase (beta-lactamase class C family)
VTNPLPRSTPADAGLSSHAVLGLLDDLVEARVELHSLMILRGGAVAVEGWWAPYTRDRQHLLYSVSKSFTSTAIGFLVDDGVLDLDDRLIDLLGRWAPAEPSARVAAMTVRHALTMTTGHTLDAIFPMLLWGMEHPGGDWLTGFFDLEPGADPGTVFAYNQLATYCLSRIVTERTGERVVDFLQPRLFEPLGIEGARWLTDGQGHDWGFSGLHVTTEDIARFGQMVLEGGVVAGRQVVSADWIAAATSAVVANDGAHRADTDQEANPDWLQGYGFQFWQSRRGFRGDGALGQFCLVWPDDDVVVVTTAATMDMQGLIDRIEQRLVPALGAATPDDDARLVDRLASLTLTPVPDHGGTNEPVAAANDGGGAARRLRSVVLRTTDDGWTLDLELKRHAGSIPVGRGRWLDGTWPGDPTLPVSTSGGWGPDGRFTVDVTFVETPHHLLLSVDPAAGTFGARWPEFPLHGSDPADFAIS